ncbi:MAG: hypothetical protein M1828_001459 [Chrysothrix sp. TS-e1954]|nr:MAG: hypothetical protein M1828_001459 [Chrysothrix sp. TS-e1954]
MATNYYQPQDLQSILNTLAAHTQPSGDEGWSSIDYSLQESQDPRLSYSKRRHEVAEYQAANASIDKLGTLPANDEYDPAAPHGTEGDPPARVNERDRYHSNVDATRATKAQVDPSTIIEWPAGLRYVSKLAAQNEDLAVSIRKMIKNQHDHERQWWSGREAILQRQKDAKADSKKIDDVLKTIGGQPTKGKPVHNDAAELKRYDVKVHKASKTMMDGMTAELRVASVPFFCTKPSLVVDTGQAETARSTGQADSQGSITRKRFTELQRKMLQHLEDLFKDNDP